MQRPRVLMIVDYYPPAWKAGGPTRSVSSIAELVDFADVYVLTRNRDMGSPVPLDVPSDQWVSRRGVNVYYMSTSSVKAWRRVRSEVRRLKADTWYLNSLFSPLASLLPLVVAGWSRSEWAPRRLVVAPRGECAPAALGHSAWRKRIALVLVRRLFARQVVWHATSTSERTDVIRTLALDETSVVLLPQPVAPPLKVDVDPLVDSNVSGARNRAVFVGRICRHKNLLLAIAALNLVPTPVQLDVYGPIEEAEYWAECTRAMAQLDGRHRCTYRGPVDPASVAAAFGEADFLLAPSLSENFGHVIYEALSAGRPVIIGDHTPWTQAVDGVCGRVVNPRNATSIALAIDRLCGLTPQQQAEYAKAAVGAAVQWARASGSAAAWSHLLLPAES